MAQTLNILSLDLSAPVIKAAVVAVNGNTLSIVEKKEIQMPSPLFEPEAVTELTAREGEAPSAPTLEKKGVPAELIDLINEIKTPWRSAVLSIPYNQGLSLNLSLPFKDQRQISKILPLEVQDLIPFEISDFHIASSLTLPANEDDVGCEVRVDLAKRESLKLVLKSLEELGIDPRVVSFPSGALATLLKLAPNYFAKNCAIISSSDAGTTVLGIVGGTPRASRNLPVPNSDAEANEILKEARLFIGNIERKYDSSLEKVYLIGSAFNPFQVKETLGHEYEFLNIQEFLKSQDESAADVVPLLAYQATIPLAQTQANFRTGEFQFRPKMKELMAGLKTLLPFGVFFVACLVATVGGVYLANESKISNLQSALVSRIQKTIPNFKAPEGQEIPTLSNNILQIENQLKEIGSISTLSALEAFLALSEDMPADLGLNVNEISIKGNKITIVGTGPDYGTIDKIEKALKEKKDRYCDIDPGDSSSGNRGGTVGFRFTLTLC